MIQTTTPVRLTAGIRVAAEGTDLARFIIGPAGQSAYELAVENGFDGTISEWLESLRGQGGGDGGVDLSGYLTRTETEAGDAATLASAMDYTDTLSAAEEQARVDGDTATLAAAQEYADGITPPAPDLTGYATDEDLAGEATARSDADTALGARIDALPAPAPAYDDSAVRQLIATEATTRSDADAALDSRVDALEAVPAPDLTGLATDAELTAEATARADADAALAGSTLRVVHHGSDGTTARPDAAAAVYWIGSAEPANALPADLWRAS